MQISRPARKLQIAIALIPFAGSFFIQMRWFMAVKKTISLSPEIAREVEHIATAEGKTVSVVITASAQSVMTFSYSPDLTVSLF